MTDGSKNDHYSDSQKTTMRALYSIGIALFSFNLAFALYNVVKYPIKNRKGGTLVILFYILTFILCLSEISLDVLLAWHVEWHPLIWTA